MKKIGLLALGLTLALGVVAEAGSIPADRVPLQTYAVKKLNCYLQPNGVQKGWIDPGDYVVVTQIRSDGWAYGSYPVGNGRVSRWFRADDLVNNIGFANQERYSPKANTNTYTGPDHSRKFGSFNDNETLLVVSESGESRQFIYKLNNGGYKMAWAPYWDCWDARQAGKQQVNNNVINKNPVVKPVQREDKKQEQTSYGVWKATARYTANTYDNPDLRGARAGWVTAGSDLEVLGENAKSYFIRYWADNGAKRERYVERTAVKGLNEDKENKKQVNNNVINKNPIVKPVQREDKKQEQTSYGVWKATARYTANTYDNPDLRGARAGWVTAGSDLEVLGENAKSYFIRYWADNGAKRERYVERTAVKGLNEDKKNKKQEQSSSYGVWKATARYTANTYDNPDLRGMRAGRVTSGSDIEVLGENAKSYFIRYWADNGAKRERYVERTAVKGLNEDKDIINNNNSSSFSQWSGKAKYRTNTYDNESLSGARAGWVTAGSDVVVLAENSKSFFIRYWTDNGDPRERYVMKSAIQKIADGAMYGVNKAVEAAKKENYIWPVDSYKISTLYYYLTVNAKDDYKHSSGWSQGEGAGQFDHHESIDIAVPVGYSVRATAAGTVVHAYDMGYKKSYGKVVIIKHDNDVYSLYGHLSQINVSKGATVSQGDTIGKSGNTGNSTGAHLHFAISKFNDQNMNTWKYFRDKYKFSYPTNGITANKKHSDRDSYSKEAIQWLNSHPHENW